MVRSQKHKYPESHLTQEALGWAKKNWGYEERFEDEQATGAPMDSAGLLSGQFVLIEVKPAISVNMSAFTEGKVGSLESKVSRALVEVYMSTDSDIGRVSQAYWDRVRPPRIVILAGKMSATGLGECSGMLARRSRDWRFDWQIWQWRSKEQVIEIASSGTAAIDDQRTPTEIRIPKLFAPAPTRKNRTIEQLTNIAADFGAGGLFAEGCAIAKELGFRHKRNVGNINFQPSRDSGRGSKSVIGFYPGKSPGNGTLNVGYLADSLARPLRRLPAAPDAGHLNTNVSVGSPATLREIFSAFI
jgi:hypothetical protein